MQELDPNAVTRKVDVPFRDPKNPSIRIIFDRFSCGWSDDSNLPILKDISVTLKDNSLLAIVGTVGSGKSTMLSAILGDTYKLDGNVSVTGTISYVPQNAWIMNATVKENVFYTNLDSVWASL
jgi:ATP-binding cassette subfamily C (CFTR/MRP) protein 1